MASFLQAINRQVDMIVGENLNLEIEPTSDNSVTLYRADIDEHYHSTKGAIVEAIHVYVKSGTEYHKKQEVRVCEIGFGTGLNALATALLSNKNVEYHTFELYPLPPELCKSLKYDRDISAIAGTDTDNATAQFEAIHNAEWGQLCAINKKFSIFKHHTDISKGLGLDHGSVDVVYFDAFAPEKQPEMWSEAIFRDVYEIMSPGGVLTTYCAKGVIRRLLQTVGFSVERIPGPAQGKREILRATKPII